MATEPKSPFGSTGGNAAGDAPVFEPFADEFDEELPRFDMGDFGDQGKGAWDPEVLKLKAQMMGAEYYIKAANIAHEVQQQSERYAEQGRSFVRERPIETVAGAFVTGLVFGAILRRL